MCLIQISYTNETEALLDRKLFIWALICTVLLLRPSGFIPVCALGLSQVGRINLGQNVSSLRYFAICGLQEGFEPFAINMKRDITMWFSKSLPQFVPVPTDHNHIEVITA